MNRIQALICAICLPAFPAAAQQQAVYSAAISDPGDGWTKLLQLHNGNTFLFHAGKKSIDITVFGKDRAILGSSQLKGTHWNAKDLPATDVKGLFEISSEPVLFLQQRAGRSVFLYRIRLDASTGKLLEEAEIAAINPPGLVNGRMIISGAPERSDFNVEKDPASDYYAIAGFDGLGDAQGKKLTVSHFSGDHRLLRRSLYSDSTETSRFRSTRYLAMTVTGSEAVHLCTYGVNSPDGKDSRIVISKLDAAGKFLHRMPEFSSDFRDTRAVMRYNPSLRVLQLMTITQSAGKQENSTLYFSLLTSFDPQTLAPLFTRPLMDEKVSFYLKREFNLEQPYSGMPQNMTVNADGSTTILSEEMTFYLSSTTAARLVAEKTQLGSIGVSVLDERGSETDGYAVAKLQLAPTYVPVLYIASKEKGSWSASENSTAGSLAPFMGYDYIDSKAGRFIIFNDEPENLQRENTGERRRLTGIANAHTVCYRVEGNRATASFPFGNPDARKITNFSSIAAAHYLPSTNTYATLVTRRDHASRQTFVAWIRFE